MYFKSLTPGNLALGHADYMIWYFVDGLARFPTIGLCNDCMSPHNP